MKPGYYRTEIGIIPEDWNLSVIQKSCVVKGRVGWKGYKKEDLRSSGPLVIGAKHIDKHNRIDLSDPTYISIEKYVESPDIMIQLGDVLLVQRGSIGKVVHINRDIGAATINPSMIILRATKIIPGFLYYFLNSAAGQLQITDDMSSTGVPMITQNQVSKFLIPMPSMKEQESIATVLDSIDSLITSLEKLIEKKKLIKQGVMQELLTGKRRLPGFNGDWETKKLGSLCSSITTGRKDVNEGNPNGKYPFFTCSRTPSFSNNYSFDTEAILIAGNGDVGTLHYFNGKFEAYQRTYVLSGFRIAARFLVHYLEDRLIPALTENKIGSSIPYIKIGDLLNMPINTPQEPEEVMAISSILDDINYEIHLLYQQLEKNKRIKIGMMQELLTGRIRLI